MTNVLSMTLIVSLFGFLSAAIQKYNSVVLERQLEILREANNTPNFEFSDCYTLLPIVFFLILLAVLTFINSLVIKKIFNTSNTLIFTAFGVIAVQFLRIYSWENFSLLPRNDEFEFISAILLIFVFVAQIIVLARFIVNKSRSFR